MARGRDDSLRDGDAWKMTANRWKTKATNGKSMEELGREKNASLREFVM